MIEKLKRYAFILVTTLIMIATVALIVRGYRQYVPIALPGQCLVYKTPNGSLRVGMVVGVDLREGSSKIMVIDPTLPNNTMIDYDNSALREYGYIRMECDYEN